MAYACESPQFTVQVTSGFISDWQWAVHAVVDYRTDGLVESRSQIEAEARLELMSHPNQGQATLVMARALDARGMHSDADHLLLRARGQRADPVEVDRFRLTRAVAAAGTLGRAGVGRLRLARRDAAHADLPRLAAPPALAGIHDAQLELAFAEGVKRTV